MKISQLFKTLHFHDSVLHKIHHLADKKQLILEIELCNYDQQGYQEGDPELLPGQLIFSGVEDFKTDPPFDTLDWEVGIAGFYTFEPVTKRDRDGLEAAESIIIKHTDVRTIVILSLLASEVEWRPT